MGIGGSFSTNLSTSIGAHQSINDGLMDGYIIKLDSNCNRIFSSYLGGSAIDDLWGNTTDALGNIYLSGHTTSTDFDLTIGAYQTTNNGSNDWFISKFSATGAFLKSTLLGGSLNDINSRMVISGTNELTLIGKTESIDFPMIGTPYQPAKSASYDVAIAKLSTTNLTPFWTSFYGGNTDEDSWDLASFSTNNFIFVGGSNSTNYPISLSAYQPTLNISNDGVFTKLHVGNLIPTEVVEISNNETTIAAYPNPIKEIVYINSSLPYSFNCTTSIGENVTQKIIIIDKKSINIKLLENGIYFLTINTKLSSRTIKIIKEE